MSNANSGRIHQSREIVVRLVLDIDSARAQIDIDEIVHECIEGMKAEFSNLVFDQDYGGILRVAVGKIDVYDPQRGKSVLMLGDRRKVRI